MKKILILLAMGFLAAGCAGGGGSGGGGSASTQSISGKDLSGTYVFDSIQCLNQSLSAITNTFYFAGNYSDTVTISGNSFSENEVSDQCTLQSTGSIVFNPNFTNANNSNLQGGHFSVSNIKYTNVTGGSCALTRTLTDPSFTPATETVTRTTGDTANGIANALYIWNQSMNQVGLLSTITNSAGAYCFIIYAKQ